MFLMKYKSKELLLRKQSIDHMPSTQSQYKQILNAWFSEQILHRQSSVIRQKLFINKQQDTTTFLNVRKFNYRQEMENKWIIGEHFWKLIQGQIHIFSKEAMTINGNQILEIFYVSSTFRRTGVFILSRQFLDKYVYLYFQCLLSAIFILSLSILLQR